MKYSAVRTIHRAAILFFLLICCALLIAPSFSFAQRTVPRLAPRDYFVGKLVLIARDLRPASWQQPRLIAQIADHDLLTPPSRLIADDSRIEQLIAWTRDFDYTEADGLIVSLDVLTGAADVGTAQQRLRVLQEIRARQPRLPIFGYVATKAVTDAAHQISQTALALVADNTLDFLLITPDQGVDVKTAQVTFARLINEINARRLTDRVALDGDGRGAPITLLVRLFNRRFGFAPKILPVYSSNAGRDALATDGLGTLGQFISAKLRALDSRELPQTAESLRSVDALLFVHTPNTNAAERQAFAASIVQTLEKGARVALVDLSETKEAKEALFAELRRRKLLDRLFSYASSTLDDETTLEAANRALAHTAALLVAFKFLRDDYHRLYRIDRAHVRLLFSRYLSDWAYALHVRPALAARVREKAALATDWNNAESFVAEQLQPLAEELFREQFRGNVHAILLINGERARFEITRLQRLQVRITPPSLEAEVNQSIHLAQLYSQAPLPSVRADWSIANERLDERLLRRFYAVEWPSFKSDAQMVELHIKLQSGNGTPEGYRITSNRKRDTRRIEIAAATPQGAFYGLSRLEQLGAEGQLTRDLQLAEAPALALRGVIEDADAPWSHQERLTMLRFLARARMNHYFYAPRYDAPERLSELLRVADENFMQMVYVLPAADGAATLTRRLNRLTVEGVRHFALRLDASGDEGEETAQQRTNTPDAQTDLTKRIHAHLQTLSGKPTLMVILTPAADTAQQRAQLLELNQVLPEVLFCVNGNPAEAQTRELLTALGRRAIVLDTSTAGEAAAWRIQLAPYRGPAALNEQIAGFVIKSPPRAYVAQLLLATAADYSWEPRSYQSETAFTRALQLLYDERSRAGVQSWAQADVARLFQPLFAAQAGEINVALVEQQIAELQTALEAISLTPERGLLRGELAGVLRRTRAALAELPHSSAHEKLPNGNYRWRNGL